jgi:hypothetical protein
MSYYMADPPPSNLDPEVSEYLNRQFVGISGALTPLGQLVAPSSGEVPKASIPGAVLYVEGDGLYACLKTTAEGPATWIKIAPIEAPEPIEPPDPIEPPEVDLSGKSWNDFL